MWFLLAACRLADGRRDGGSAVACRTDYAGVIGMDLALIARLIVTGCLHEDGLADFFDGFGGGTTRERTLAIMKDSHIGSYGVIGLICYFLLLLQLHHLPLGLLCILVLCGDCWSKFCASQIVNYLPMPGKRKTAKARPSTTA